MNLLWWKSSIKIPLEKECDLSNKNPWGASGPGIGRQMTYPYIKCPPKFMDMMGKIQYQKRASRIQRM